jgi:hypothetical protein
VREPEIDHEGRQAPVEVSRLLGPGIAAAAGLTVVAGILVAVLDAMQATRANPPAAFDIGAAMWRLSHPMDVGGWLQIVGILAFAVVGGLFIAATRAKQARAAGS